MSEEEELVQNLIDTLDNAHSQRLQLTELLSSLQEAKDQVCESATVSRKMLQEHFAQLRDSFEKALNKRLGDLMLEIDAIEQKALQPLDACGELINHGIDAAAHIMEEGKHILANNPGKDIERLKRFKDKPEAGNLNSLPEIPCLCDVAQLTVKVSNGLPDQLCLLLQKEGRVIERAPVQISDVEPMPGSLLIRWAEVTEEAEITQFCLQYCYGSVKHMTDVTFHTAYVGPHNSCLVKHLRTNTSYTLRVRGRSDADSDWSPWSVPRVAMTTIPHYKWSSNTDGYSYSNENKTATRTSEGISQVLYSDGPIYSTGQPIAFRVMDTGEKSPMDSIGLTLTSNVTDTLKRPEAVCVTMDGSVFVDGQEMKTKLPSLSRNSLLTFETESLPNGKVRVSVQVEEKDVTFDWRIGQSDGTRGLLTGLAMLEGETASKNLYFAMMFSHEDWKVGVE
ncbi:hypothetical protein CHS0354_008029 [Potamilus streckersoni]|uniref:Fibronectin type-III domain-containing protein n=1 Tax=Potamilus streckersoni TaxID=2493646 RepID=A0AAE0RLU9_9BIVA|nr:hypothetical protein CHS0354_008029 [Potamilus streckersoni]